MEIINNIIITTGNELKTEIFNQLTLNEIGFDEQINIDVSDPKCIVISQPSKEVAGNHIEQKQLIEKCEHFIHNQCDCLGIYCQAND